MKFMVYCTSGEAPFPHTGVFKSWRQDETKEKAKEDYYLEVQSLPDLIELVREHGSIIVSDVDWCKGWNFDPPIEIVATLEIYDHYREG